MPLKQKRNLLRCLSFRARKICSTSTLENELKLIENVLLENGYPLNFIRKNLDEKTKSEPIQLAQKKELYIQLPFKGDPMCEYTSKRLQLAIKRTYPAALLRLSFNSRKMIYPHSKDKLPVLTTSMVTYSFVCSCSANYIGRTTRQLATRVKEHKPAWLGSGSIKTLSSAIVTHLAETGHTADVQDCFKILYRVPPNRSKTVRQRILATAEAIAIKLFKPTLCSQKKFVKALKLPWPDTQTSPDSTQRPGDE